MSPCFLWAEAADNDALTSKKYSLNFSIIDEEGNPIPDVNLELSEDWKNKSPKKQTDSQGICSFTLKTDPDNVYVHIQHKQYVGKIFHWWDRKKNRDKFLHVYVTLYKGRLVGGIVQDEKGNPLADVRLNAHLKFKKDNLMCGRNLELEVAYKGQRAFKTDKEGKWEFRTFPGNLTAINFSSIFHKQYFAQANRYAIDVTGNKRSYQELRDKSYLIQLQPGIPVTGIVSDENGKPVSKALVIADLYPNEEIYTDDKGHFRLPAQEKGTKRNIFIYKKGYALWSERIELVSHLNCILDAGVPLKGKILDNYGNPLENVKIKHRMDKDFANVFSDKNGEFTITHFPVAGQVKYGISKEGFFGYRDFPLSAGMKDLKIVLYSNIEISGTVNCEDTGNSPNRFFVQWRYPSGGGGHGGRKDGFFQEILETSWYPDDYKKYIKKGVDITVSVKTKGYEEETVKEHVELGKTFGLDFDFELRKAHIQKGKVVGSDGKACEGVKIRITDRNLGSWLVTEELMKWEWDETPRAFSGNDGDYSLQFLKKNSPIVFIHSKGIAVIDSDSLKIQPKVTLKAWGSLEGQVLLFGKPAPFASVHYSVNVLKTKDLSETYTDSANADKDGFFKFSNVPPGEFEFSYGKQFSDHTITGILKPGESQKIDFKIDTLVVKAQLIPKMPEKGIDFKDILSSGKMSILVCMVVPDKIPEGIPLPKNWEKMSIDKKGRYLENMKWKNQDNEEIFRKLNLYKYNTPGQISNSGELSIQLSAPGLYSISSRINNCSEDLAYFKTIPFTGNQVIQHLGDLKFNAGHIILWDKNAKKIKGKVVTPEGRPAGGAIIACLDIWGIEFPEQNSSSKKIKRFIANAKGEFEIPVLLNKNVGIGIVHQSGCAEFANFNEFMKKEIIQLNKWGKVRGRFALDDTPIENVRVSLSYMGKINRYNDAQTDKKGDFSFEYIPSGVVSLSFALPEKDGEKVQEFSFVRWLKVQTGELSKVNLNLKGSRVFVKILLPDGKGVGKKVMDDFFCEVYLMLPHQLPPKEKLPKNWDVMSQAEKEEWFSDLESSAEGKGILADGKYIMEFPAYLDAKNPIIRMNNLPAGKYLLLTETYDGKFFQKRTFIVPGTKENGQPKEINLGEMKLISPKR